jgi:glyoxylase I family protein
VLDRLASLGVGGEPRIMPTPGGGLAATVVDPDGVVVELLDQAVSLG